VKASGESMKPAKPCKSNCARSYLKLRRLAGEVINLSGEAQAEIPKPPITYARNDQPFVKVLATPKGQPAPAMVLPARTAPDEKSVDQGTRVTLKRPLAYGQGVFRMKLPTQPLRRRRTNPPRRTRFRKSADSARVSYSLVVVV
jgi:hypothetical protein